MAKQRLDILLVKRDLCCSRQQAQALIRAGEVMVNQQVVDKPGTEVDIAALIEIKERARYVSRGGEKLAKALEFFGINVQNRICLDGGISTGGFTDCLLQAGAKLVYGVDVGYGQVDWRLRNDARVILKERTNLRYLTKEELYGRSEDLPDLGVVDVSFISLSKILPALWGLLRSPREVVLLVKPQFEVGRERVGKKGVVRDPDAQAEAIASVLQTATQLGWRYRGLTCSPLTGAAGNLEYLLWLDMYSQTPAPEKQALFEFTRIAQKEINK
ncbi:MAG: TlyA family RNA methyltransferase [Oscillatoriaceae bacterium SKW80]|nr:TlyA family RNA methyltransferase [Oscillatoriaceae bacterium SKYG93]MCX8120851.1 TlyA family RNA methyltransferase [Oscillatoriaceae bacterium SKW80]MDW8454192.1 TlyA family RNA methyltransferase [Oscillatoriaceae cyanobacterium SKYGB_i_bin93]HIK26483.1 TlyA family RNA methyltransferase [Oscillatoriaceae cyanobacterium M7585_C2015_266]